jgi:hypothetical protein
MLWVPWSRWLLDWRLEHEKGGGCVGRQQQKFCHGFAWWLGTAVAEEWEDVKEEPSELACRRFSGGDAIVVQSCQFRDQIFLQMIASRLYDIPEVQLSRRCQHPLTKTWSIARRRSGRKLGNAEEKDWIEREEERQRVVN